MLNKSAILFELSEDQVKKLTEWVEKLPQANTGAVGGRLEYIFIPNSIGIVCKVRDLVTKTEIDLTDYNEW